jgi:hypothetical protein
MNTSAFGILYTMHRLGRGVVVEVTKYAPKVGYNFLI